MLEKDICNSDNILWDEEAKMSCLKFMIELICNHWSTNQAISFTDHPPYHQMRPWWWTPLNWSEKSSSFVLTWNDPFYLLWAVGLMVGGACVQNWEEIEKVIAIWTFRAWTIIKLHYVILNNYNLLRCHWLAYSCYESVLIKSIKLTKDRQTDRTWYPGTSEE